MKSKFILVENHYGDAGKNLRPIMVLCIIGVMIFLGAPHKINNLDTASFSTAPREAGPMVPFISHWDTTNSAGMSGHSDANTIVLPLVGSGSYDFMVDWGDSNVDYIVDANYTDARHTYASAGEYNITITGLISGWSFSHSGDRNKLEGIIQWGSLNLGNEGHYFEGCQNLVSFDYAGLNDPTNILDLTGTTNLAYAFRNCYSLTAYDLIDQWDVSSVTMMNDMFYKATVFNQSLNMWDVSSVTTMQSMFEDAESFNQPLNFWDVSNVENMLNMFSGAESFNQPLDNWDVSKVFVMYGMFYQALVFNQPLNAWDVSNVNEMNWMFYQAESFNQPLDNWNVSKVTNMANMFDRAKAFNQSLNTWNVSAVTNMEAMFQSTDNFNQPLDNWDVSHVTNMERMFNYAKAFDQPLGMWNISQVSSFTSFLAETTMSPENYNALLNGWVNFVEQSGIYFTADTWYYGEDAKSAHNLLYSTYNWMINDNGLYISPVENLLAETGNNSVIISWEVPAITSEYTLDGYEVYSSDNDDYFEYLGITSTLNYTHSLDASDYRIGREVYYRVFATGSNASNTPVNQDGDPGKSIIGIPGGYPSAPNLDLDENTPNQVNISIEISNNGGFPVLHYSLFRSDDYGTNYYLIASPASDDEFYIDSNVTGGRIYYYKISVTTEFGESDLSYGYSCYVIGIPGIPTYLSANNWGSEIEVSWWEPESDGGGIWLNYTLWRSTSENGEYDLLANSSDSSYYDNNFVGGNTYYYKVGAYNEYGAGELSDPVSCTIYGAPDMPQSITATSQQDGIALNWVAPTNFGAGADSVFYIVLKTTDPEDMWDFLGEVFETHYLDTNVTEGVTYFYTIIALNDGAVSEEPEPVSCTYDPEADNSGDGSDDTTDDTTGDGTDDTTGDGTDDTTGDGTDNSTDPTQLNQVPGYPVYSIFMISAAAILSLIRKQKIRS